MKQIKFFLVMLVCLVASGTALADDKPIPVEQLPDAAKTFVANNFKGKKILYAEKDWDSFECRLNDGTKVEFNRKGEWDNVECNAMNEVPAAIVPEAIKKYVTTNFEGCKIKKIDKERYGFEIELSNDVDLKFNKEGGLVGIDD